MGDFVVDSSSTNGKHGFIRYPADFTCKNLQFQEDIHRHTIDLPSTSAASIPKFLQKWSPRDFLRTKKLKLRQVLEIVV
jgi:hypothetical protein